MRIQILAGDFNMSLFMVRPELQRRKVQVQLAAWYPWKTETGEARSDSCGIFWCEGVGQFALQVGRENLHNFFGDAPTKTSAAVAANSGETKELKVDIHKGHDGPGYAFSSYLPSNANNRIQDGARVVEKTFLPHEPSEERIAARKAAVAEVERAQKQGWRKCDFPAVPPLLRTKQLKMDAEMWKIEGNIYRGSHMPIAVGLNVVAHRSDEAKARRHNKSAQIWHDKKLSWKRDDEHSWHSRHHCTERSSWSRSCGSDADWQSAGGWQHRGWNNEEGTERTSWRQEQPEPEKGAADEPQPQGQTELAPQQQRPWASLDDGPAVPCIWQPIVSMAQNHMQTWQEGFNTGWASGILAISTPSPTPQGNSEGRW